METSTKYVLAGIAALCVVSKLSNGSFNPLVMLSGPKAPPLNTPPPTKALPAATITPVPLGPSVPSAPRPQQAMPPGAVTVPFASNLPEVQAALNTLQSSPEAQAAAQTAQTSPEAQAVSQALAAVANSLPPGVSLPSFS